MNEKLRVYIRICRVFLYELAAWSYIVSHQHGEDIIYVGGIVDCYLFQIRVSGFIVVSHSCSGFISPKPLYRCVWIPFSCPSPYF